MPFGWIKVMHEDQLDTSVCTSIVASMMGKSTNMYRFSPIKLPSLARRARGVAYRSGYAATYKS